MKILNLGCGSKVSGHPDVINLDWSPLLRLRRNPALRAISPILLNGERRERYKVLPLNILAHDISKGLPFKSQTVDVIFHSHFLEHLDRSVVPNFLRETRRVLKTGGIHRLVVPNFAVACLAYVSHLEKCYSSEHEAARHDSFIADILEQSVRRDAHGTSKQKSIRRIIETWILGDARQRGETHQWGYDRINLKVLLADAGYSSPTVRGFNNSSIPMWQSYGLEQSSDGSEYKPDSLYFESIK